MPDQREDAVQRVLDLFGERARIGFAALPARVASSEPDDQLRKKDSNVRFTSVAWVQSMPWGAPSTSTYSASGNA